jgi:2-polyprenyl-3-methyl-5-hydroxy-6-metoxy-1,4-benzoquinol methylase
VNWPRGIEAGGVVVSDEVKINLDTEVDEKARLTISRSASLPKAPARAYRAGMAVPEPNGDTREPAERTSTRDGYERWAALYDDEDNPLIALEAPLVTELLGDTRGLDVVDLGCGTGRHAAPLARAGARVTALDFADGMVARARAKPGWERVRFIAHDLTQPLPLPDRSFDRVLSCLVIEHLADVTSFFGECRRICREDGFILVSAMHPAMFLIGRQARFTDPATGRKVQPRSYPSQIADYVMGALRGGLMLDAISEHVVTEALVARSPRSAKYLGWPLLLLMRLRR